MFSKIGLTEILIIFGILLLIFGPSKIPSIGKSFGKGLREFKDATQDVKKTLEDTEKNLDSDSEKKDEN